MREDGVVVAVHPGFVRSAMPQDVAHPVRAERCGGIEPVTADDSCNAAHGYAATPTAAARTAGPSTNFRNQVWRAVPSGLKFVVTMTIGTGAGDRTSPI
jgi:hypothetical protein